MFDYTGKTVIVAGAASGIGRGIAEGFAKAGANVSIWDYNEEQVKKTSEELNKAGYKTIAVQVDVTDEENVKDAVQETLKAFNGRVDVMVDSAGIMIHGDETKVPPESVSGFRRVVEVNLIGAYICAAAIFPVMRAQHYGRIIFVASNVHKRISVGRVPSYTASKSGEVALARHLAVEGGNWGITVNCLCPGATLTPMLAAMSTKEQLEERERLIPDGRLAKPEDHANLALFLGSDESSHITGQAIDVDGGQIIPWMDRPSYFKSVPDFK